MGMSFYVVFSTKFNNHTVQVWWINEDWSFVMGTYICVYTIYTCIICMDIYIWNHHSHVGFMQPLRWKVQKAIAERGRQEGVVVLSVTWPGQLPIPKLSERQGSLNWFFVWQKWIYVCVLTQIIDIWYLDWISKTLEVYDNLTLISLKILDPDKGLVTKTSLRLIQ